MVKTAGGANLAHMKKHAASMRPKFDTVLASLEKELGGLEIGSWLAPRGGYFISFDSLDGCAKAIVAKAKEAGLIMTNAGATYPYGKDPHDSNIRIAPSYPTLDEIKRAMEVFTLSVKLVSVEKLLERPYRRAGFLRGSRLGPVLCGALRMAVCGYVVSRIQHFASKRKRR